MCTRRWLMDQPLLVIGLSVSTKSWELVQGMQRPCRSAERIEEKSASKTILFFFFFLACLFCLLLFPGYIDMPSLFIPLPSLFHTHPALIIALIYNNSSEPPSAASLKVPKPGEAPREFHGVLLHIDVNNAAGVLIMTEKELKLICPDVCSSVVDACVVGLWIFLYFTFYVCIHFPSSACTLVHILSFHLLVHLSISSLFYRHGRRWGCGS